MVFDSLVINAVLSEIRNKISGGVVQKIKQSEDDEILMEIRAFGFNYNLLFSVASQFARINLSSSGIKSKSVAPDFCMILRKYLYGCIIKECLQIGFDRIIKIKFCNQKSGESFYLIQEIMGKHSNLVLIDEKNKILGCLKSIGSSVSKVRQILIGKDYVLPPNVSRINLMEVSFDLFKKTLLSIPEDLDRKEEIKLIINNFMGISPVLAEEIWYDISIRKDFEIAFEKIKKIKIFCKKENNSCYLITDQNGLSVGVYPIQLSSIEDKLQIFKESINETVDVAFKGIIVRKLLSDTRNNLLISVNKAISAKKSSIKSCKIAIEKAKKAEKQKEIGDLLMGSLYIIEKGMEKLELTDYFDPNMPIITVDLDPKITPVQNAEKYFKKYKKSKEAGKTSTERLAILENDLNILEQKKEEIISETSIKNLKELHKDLLNKNLLRVEITKENDKPEFEGFRIKRTYSNEGWEILYGENSQSNDHLTTKLGKPNDIWLHARQITGSHVIIRTTAKTASNVPYNTILFAAKIAAINSEAKHSSIVPIDYTFKKHVRKPRGSATGFVLYKMEKTIDVQL